MELNEHGLPIVGEIKDLNFDPRTDGSKPHLAVCHYIQGFGANGWGEADLVRKSKNQTTEIVKAMKDAGLPQELIQKMSYRNMKQTLNEAIETYIRGNMAANGEYVWVDVFDFNDERVGFYFQETHWSVDYTVVDEVVVLGEDIRKGKELYVVVDSETGEELIKANFWKKENPEFEEERSSDTEGAEDGETQSTPDVNEEEENMSDIDKTQLEELMKSAEMQELVKAQAQVLAKEQLEELQKAAQEEELRKSTVEILKGVEAIGEDLAETLVKSVLVSDHSVELLKAFGDMQDLLVKAREEKQEAIEKAEKIKDEFGSQDSLDGEVTDKVELTKSKKETLEAFVAKNKPKQA